MGSLISIVLIACTVLWIVFTVAVFGCIAASIINYIARTTADLFVLAFVTVVTFCRYLWALATEK